MHRRIRLAPLVHVAALAACGVLLLAARGDLVSAAEDLPPEVEIDRDSLARDLRPRPDDDTVDTALVFTNLGTGHRVAKCIGFDEWGRAVGRVRFRIPSRGLRYVLASDLSQGADFVGRVNCKADGRVFGSGFLLGAQLTDVPALNHHRGFQSSQIDFPVVATF